MWFSKQRKSRRNKEKFYGPHLTLLSGQIRIWDLQLLLNDGNYWFCDSVSFCSLCLLHSYFTLVILIRPRFPPTKTQSKEKRLPSLEWLKDHLAHSRCRKAICQMHKWHPHHCGSYLHGYVNSSHYETRQLPGANSWDITCLRNTLETNGSSWLQGKEGGKVGWLCWGLDSSSLFWYFEFFRQ